MKKRAVEILLVKATLTGVPERRLIKSRNLGAVDLVWPRTGVARKSAAREMVFRKGVADFTLEAWTKRILFREEVEGRCGLAVTVTEPVSVQKARRFLRLTAKYALKMGADFMEKAMVGYVDVASAPLDAMAQMVGEKDTPEAIAQGVLDLDELPADGETREIVVPLFRPSTGRETGAMTLLVRAG